MNRKTSIVQADLSKSAHQKAVLYLINQYACDPMGNGRPLPPAVRRSLVARLKKHPTTIIFLAYSGEEPAGIAVCFTGFSTFKARPLINIHDFAVLPQFRGMGIGRKLMAAVEKKARAMKCCKLTLEVLQNNHRARHVYKTAGFGESVYRTESGAALFLVKAL